MMFPNILNWIANSFGLNTEPSSESVAKPKRKRRPNGVNVRLAVTLPAQMVEEIQQAAEDEGLPVSVVVERRLRLVSEEPANLGVVGQTTTPQILPDCPVLGVSVD